MTEKEQKKSHNQILAEMETNLASAYRIINQQQQQIQRLQEQLSQNQNYYYQKKSTFTPKKSPNLPIDNLSYPRVKRKNLHHLCQKKLQTSKPASLKLSKLQFIGIVAIVAIFMTLMSLALVRRKNPSLSHSTVAHSETVPTPKKSNFSLANLPNSQHPITLPKSQKLPSPVTALPPIPQTTSLPQILPPIWQEQQNSVLAYNIKTAPNFQKSKPLQTIVDEIVALTTTKGLPKQALSITLIDAKTGEYAEYQQETPRFPASVVKMFWMVYLYAEIENGIWRETDFIPYLSAMIKKSDNNAASYILDSITNTQSGLNLEDQQYENWLNQRKQVNNFFQQAGYEKININQKTFPINEQKIYEPQGADLKMRGNPKNPIRNKITTQQAARLLYEIYDGQAISQMSSERMASWLEVEPNTRIEKKNQLSSDEFNPVRGYFSESLPTDVYFGGKAGWTSSSRQEAAYIASRDGKAAYILVVFGDDKAYAYDWKIFPNISRKVFERMKSRQLSR